jgi:predicted MPP superfamily phosphohydrolase
MPMSASWQWLAILVAALLPALGHVYHFVLIVNVGSGLGYSETGMERARAALLVLLVVTSGLLFVGHIRDPWWNWDWPLRGYAILCIISAAVVGPSCSARLALRRRPQGITGESCVRDLASSAPNGELIGGGRGGWILRLPGNESLRLHLRDWEVQLDDLPEPFHGLQVVQLTDLHLAACFDRKFFEAVVESCLGWHADLLVVTGDLVEEDATVEWIEPLLRPLEARIGKFAILGNHDKDHHPDHIMTELHRAGFEALDGSWVTIERDDATLTLGLTSEPWGQSLDWNSMPPADFRILLSHSPDQFYSAVEHGINLVLAGHNHGGQIRLPLVGPVFMPSRYSRRFDRGFFRRGKTLMYVSEGVAGKHPYRYGCPPEVTRFVLRARSRTASRTVGATVGPASVPADVEP